MAVSRVPLAGTFGQREPGEDKDQLLKNAYVETIDLGTKKAGGTQERTDGEDEIKFVTKRMGLKTYDDLSAATTDTGRGCRNWKGAVYSVVGDELFKDDEDLGQVITSSGRVYFDEVFDGSGLLCFQDGTTIYTVNTSDEINAYNNGGSGGATDVENLPTAFQPGLLMLDQYLFVMDSQGNIHNSAIGDVTTWNGDSINMEARADPGVAIARYINYVVGFGQNTINVFYDAANTNGSPLNRFEGMLSNVGCPAGSTIQECDQDLYFVAKSPDGGRFVAKMSGGFSVEKVSTQAIDEILDKEGSNITNAWALHIRKAGKHLYVLTLPTTAGRTFVYDLTEERWYEWTSDVSDTESHWTVVDVAEFNGKVICLDEDNGLQYDLDAETYQDQTGSNETIKYEIRTKIVDGGTMQNKFLWRATLVGDLNSSSGVATLEYSDDDYQTWSTARDIDLDSYQNWLTRLGMFKRRAFRIKHEQNAPCRLQYLELNGDMGHYARS